MPSGGGFLRLARAFSRSKEFDLYACQECGFTSWFIKPDYLKKK
jgi:hypothetical protein